MRSHVHALVHQAARPHLWGGDTCVLHAVSQGCLLSQRPHGFSWFLPQTLTSHREEGVIKPVWGGSWETFHGCILQPRRAPLLNKQLIESELPGADGGGAASTCVSALSRPLPCVRMMMM